jgi:hypothetical protein
MSAIVEELEEDVLGRREGDGEWEAEERGLGLGEKAMGKEEVVEVMRSDP